MPEPVPPRKGRAREAEPRLLFYQQGGNECSYLPGRTSGSIFTWPTELTLRQFSVLLDNGFRRSGSLIYRAECEGCSQCVSIRVDVEAFAPSGDQRRALKKNHDLRLEVGTPTFTDEKLALYQRFVSERYPGKELPTAEEFEQFLVSNLGHTLEFRYTLEGKLVGVGVVDVVPEAASSVYFYFDPAHAQRSLGTYSALQEIAFCRDTGRRWLHLGYWVKDCKAMTYKSRFRPHQLLSRRRGWIAEADWCEDDL